MKVLVVATTVPAFSGDGQPRFILDLCKHYGPEVEIKILAPSAAGLSAEGVIEGVAVSRFRYFFNQGEKLSYGSGILANLKSSPLLWFVVPFFLLGLLLAIRKEVAIFKPDIVHAHWWFPVGLAAVLASNLSKAKPKLVVTCHGADYFVLGRKLPGLMAWVFSKADKVAMVSRSMLLDAVGKSIETEKVVVAPMGVDLEQTFVPGPVGARKGVLFAGRLVEKKGVDILLRAWEKLPAEIRSEGLTVIGSGAGSEQLLQQAQLLKITDTVEFLGAINHDQLPAYFQKAQLLIFPSTVASDGDQEGLGLVAIEAMGCGCPVLSSDIASLSGVIEEGITGRVFRMGDDQDLAENIQALLGDTALCNSLAKNARERVLSEYNWPQVSARYQSLFTLLNQ